MKNEVSFDKVKNALNDYIKHLKTYSGGEEMRHRTAFENFLNAIKPKNITIIQEDRHSGLDIAGVPDFFVYENYGSPLRKLTGFIECKKPSYNIKKLLESDQVKKYALTCSNIILTNYEQFILLQNGKVWRGEEVLLAGKEAPPGDKTILDIKELFEDFCSCEYPYIKTKRDLISALASTSFYYAVALRQYVSNKANSDNAFYMRFNFLFAQFQSSINYHYELADFCDVYSQSLVYGLLLVRLDTGLILDEGSTDYINKIPLEYGLLYEFLGQAWDSRAFPTEIKTALFNICKRLNLIDIDSISEEFRRSSNGKDTIAVYLYEDFLQQYDKLRETENRKESGVYYTPREAAVFITRSVDYILKNTFKLQEGFLHPAVRTLDFACGTGTFLRSVFDIIIPDDSDELNKVLAKKKILSDIYGFEVLFTPYIISHTILMQYLKGKGIKLKEEERLGIYLTNTLDIGQHSISDAMPLLHRENRKSSEIKTKDAILAIIGNPPYFNGKSRADSAEIDVFLKDYKTDLHETRVNLDDMYIKFIRFAEWKIAEWNIRQDKSNRREGVIGIITNNSFLDGLTHRRMREHLYNTFDEVYVLNLHGNTRKGETDKNIFDVMIGVAIIFFVKYSEPAKTKRVYYFSTKDAGILTREEKLEFLNSKNISNVKWRRIYPAKTKNFWFVRKDLSLDEEYSGFWKLTDIFSLYGSGASSLRDRVCIAYNKKALQETLAFFTKHNETEIREKYKLTDSRDWKLSDAKQDIVKNNNDDEYIREILYRPFDVRWTFYSGANGGFFAVPQKRVNANMFKRNLALIFPRGAANKFSHCFISDTISEYCCGGAHSAKETNLAPLYTYENNKKTPNWTAPRFTNGHNDKKYFSDFLQTLEFKPAPEEVLAYIYAVLHSNIYRTKYIEFLKTDFPAIPFTKNKDIFYKYALLGQKLIGIHLLKEVPDDGSITANGKLEGNFAIIKIKRTPDKLLLETTPNGTITLDGITTEIYNFEIGSYKPIDKWLKYRIKDGVLLNIADLQHLRKMALAIKATIAVMKEIEALGEGLFINELHE